MNTEHDRGGSAVIAGIDGTPASLHAVSWAAAEAALRRLPLQILHAAPHAAGSDAAARRRAQSPVPVEVVRPTHVALDHPDADARAPEHESVPGGTGVDHPHDLSRLR